MLSHVFGAVDKTSSSFSAHGKIGNFIIIIIIIIIVTYLRTYCRLVMGQVVIVAVLVCCGLLSVANVETLPLQLCSFLVNHVQSLIAADQPLSHNDLSLYLACIGVRQQQSDERELIDLQQNVQDDRTAGQGGWSSELCATVDCIALRASLTFEPCARLTHAQCAALVSALESVISTNSQDAAAAVQFGQLLARYRKWSESGATDEDQRKKRHADVTGQQAHNESNYGANDRGNRNMSPEVAPDAGGPRMRRSTAPRMVLSEKMTPETRAVVRSYLEWREQNGYGRVRGRWG